MSTLSVENKSKISELISLNLSWKVPVNLATTANITLSGEQTIDGVSAVSGDLVLVKNQSTFSQNGIYTVNKGAWLRAPSMPVGSNAAGVVVFVLEGTVWSNSVFKQTTLTETNGVQGAIVGTDDLSFVELSSGAVSVSTGTLAVTDSSRTGTSGNMVAGAITVPTGDLVLAATDVIVLTHETIGGTPGALYVSSRTNGAAGVATFDIGSTSGTDTSTVRYLVINTA